MQIADLVPFVRIELPGVLDSVIVQAIAQAASEFCFITRTWDEIQDPITLVDGQGQYDIDFPPDARAIGVGDVWAADRELESITMGLLALKLPTWQTSQSNQPIYYNASRDWKQISVYPIPMNALSAQLTFRVHYAPTINSTTLPDFLAERYFDVLASGAKARLMRMQNVNWTNMAAAAMHQKVFDDAVVSGQIDQFHDRVPGSVRVKPRRFM